MCNAKPGQLYRFMINEETPFQKMVASLRKRLGAKDSPVITVVSSNTTVTDLSKSIYDYVQGCAVYNKVLLMDIIMVNFKEYNTNIIEKDCFDSIFRKEIVKLITVDIFANVLQKAQVANIVEHIFARVTRKKDLVDVFQIKRKRREISGKLDTLYILKDDANVFFRSAKRAKQYVEEYY